MHSRNADKGFRKRDDDPMILLFSPRTRIRDILTVGLVQNDYLVVQAETSYLLTIKAYQFLPDLIIADITVNNTRDILLIPRLKKSTRTRNITVLLIIPAALRDHLQKVLLENLGPGSDSVLKPECIIEYPFHFATLQKRVGSIVYQRKKEIASLSGGENQDEFSRRRIAEKLYDPDIPMFKKLDEIEATINKQWAFPFTVIRALDIIESDASCCNELGKCISTDPGASAAILRVANTVHYARRGKPISDLTDGVVRLGFRETRNLLACLALIDLSPDLEKRYGFSRQEFWLHSLSTALIAEKLAADCGHRRPELAFIAGLVHDLGKIPLDNNFHPVFSHLLEETANTVSSFFETEQRLIGVTHSALGHFLATKWNFPSAISSAILNHHEPDRILATSTPIDRIVQSAVYAANIFSKAMNMGHSCDEFIDEIAPQILSELKISRGPSPRFFSEIFRRLHLLCRYLNISMKTLMLAKPSTEADKFEIVIVYQKQSLFHPLLLALQNNGFKVTVAGQYTPKTHPYARAVISISEKGSPLDLMLYEDETAAAAKSSVLKIFLLDALPGKEITDSFDEDEIVFMRRQRLDIRLILHTLDHYFERVIGPERAEIKKEEAPLPGNKGPIVIKSKQGTPPS